MDFGMSQFCFHGHEEFDLFARDLPPFRPLSLPFGIVPVFLQKTERCPDPDRSLPSPIPIGIGDGEGRRRGSRRDPGPDPDREGPGPDRTRRDRDRREEDQLMKTGLGSQLCGTQSGRVSEIRSTGSASGQGCKSSRSGSTGFCDPRYEGIRFDRVAVQRDGGRKVLIPGSLSFTPFGGCCQFLPRLSVVDICWAFAFLSREGACRLSDLGRRPFGTGFESAVFTNFAGSAVFSKFYEGIGWVVRSTKKGAAGPGAPFRSTQQRTCAPTGRTVPRVWAPRYAPPRYATLRSRSRSCAPTGRTIGRSGEDGAWNTPKKRERSSVPQGKGPFYEKRGRDRSPPPDPKGRVRRDGGAALRSRGVSVSRVRSCRSFRLVASIESDRRAGSVLLYANFWGIPHQPKAEPEQSRWEQQRTTTVGKRGDPPHDDTSIRNDIHNSTGIEWASVRGGMTRIELSPSSFGFH